MKKKKAIKIFHRCFNSFPASGDVCHLLITLANSLDPDQAWQNVWSDLDPNCLNPSRFFEKVNLWLCRRYIYGYGYGALKKIWYFLISPQQHRLWVFIRRALPTPTYVFVEKWKKKSRVMNYVAMEKCQRKIFKLDYLKRRTSAGAHQDNMIRVFTFENFGT